MVKFATMCATVVTVLNAALRQVLRARDVSNARIEVQRGKNHARVRPALGRARSRCTFQLHLAHLSFSTVAVSLLGGRGWEREW